MPHITYVSTKQGRSAVSPIRRVTFDTVFRGLSPLTSQAQFTKRYGENDIAS